MAAFRRDGARLAGRVRAVALHASPTVERAAWLLTGPRNTCSMWWRSLWLTARGGDDRERRPKPQGGLQDSGMRDGPTMSNMKQIVPT